MSELAQDLKIAIGLIRDLHEALEAMIAATDFVEQDNPRLKAAREKAWKLLGPTL